MRDARCGNCIHCGESMADTDHQCPNDECLTNATTLPVWPWSRCAGCGGNVLKGMVWYHVLRFIAQPVLGLLLVLVTFFWLSARMRGIGAVLVIGWFFARKMFSVVRELDARRLSEAKERDRLESLKSALRWDLIPGRDEPAKEKFVKDASDKVNATEWRLVRERTLVRLVNFITAILVLGILATYGPGKFLPWKVVSGWFSSSAEKVHQTIVNSTAYKATVGDLKKSLDFSAEKANYAYSLLQERGLDDSQIQSLLVLADYDYGMLIDLADKSRWRGQSLFTEIQASLKVHTASTTVKASSFPAEGKTYGQRWRESMWITLLIINLILPPLLLIHILFLIAASIIHGCYLITSELGDDIKLSWERIMERQRAKDAVAKGVPYTPIVSSAGAEAAGVGKIVIVDIIMEVLQALMRKFGLMDHFK